MKKLTEMVLSNIACNAASEADRLTRKLRKAIKSGRAISLSQSDVERIVISLRRTAQLHDHGKLALAKDAETLKAENKRDREFRMEQVRNAIS